MTHESWIVLGKELNHFPRSLFCRTAVGKRTLILAIVIIIIGVALIVYQDPQFRLALNSSSTSDGVIQLFHALCNWRHSSSSQSITTSFSAMEIIESLVGLGLVGIGSRFRRD